jgi:ATP-dependent Lon protease
MVDLLGQWDDYQRSTEDESEDAAYLQAASYPLLALRDQVVFPHVVSPLFIGRDQSIKAVEAAYARHQTLVVVAQRFPDVEDPGLDDLYRVGTEIEIARVMRLPDGTTSALVQGQRRVAIQELSQDEPYLVVTALPLAEVEVDKNSVEALMRAVLALFERCAQLSRTVSEEAYIFAMNITEPGHLADMVSSSLDLKLVERQELLQEIDPEQRLKRLSVLLARELDVLELEERIHSLVQQEVDRSQREFFLREQMRVIQNELGEGDVFTQEVGQLREQILESDMPEAVRDKALHEIDRFSAMPPLSPETGIIRTYLDWLLELPWGETTEDNLDISRAEEILDASHFGLRKVKERILEHIAVRRLAADQTRSPILCFVGPPGTGKTSIGKSIAEALGRNFVRVSLGGVRDEAEIRGHRRTYIGAMPGRIIQTMRQAQTINPVFMLDEIDKLGADFRGDPSAALLEALDPEQNQVFSDHYLEVPYDLSQVMFITTANVLGPIPPALYDRMEIIDFSGYIEEEKIEIAQRFLIPKQLREHGLSDEQRHEHQLADHPIRFSNGSIRIMIREYTYEAGVRSLERQIAQVCRKLARQVAEGKRIPQRINSKSLARHLGPPPFDYWKGLTSDQVGVATGVAWTEAGGDLMPIEVILMEGKGNLTLTGQLGEVMQESAQAAQSYARSLLSAHPLSVAANARLDAEDDEDDFDQKEPSTAPPDESPASQDADQDEDLDEGGATQIDFDKLDIHIHVPEGAIPKDGPSAGITLATALISALLGKPVRKDVAMTGELTLSGRVLPIGGLKEKAMCAHRAGIKTFLLPARNRKDMVDIPNKVQRDMSFVFVDSMAEVLEQALLAPTEVQRRGS